MDDYTQSAAEFHSQTLDNPIRRHEADGFGSIPAVSATDEKNSCVASDAANVPDLGTTGPGLGMLLPADPAERKNLPITTGVLDYFPLALAEVARVSKAGNDQHNPGQPLHWAKGKSVDHADCIARHLIDRFSRDSDGQRHAAKLAWRALALLETLLEQEAAK